MKKLVLLIVLTIYCTTIAKSQNTTITDSNSYIPHQSAILDVYSTTKGMLVPRLTALQRTTISNPATGLLVFDTDSISFFFYNGSSWQNLAAPGASTNSVWAINNNKVYLNNSNAKVGIGTNNPAAKLTVAGDAGTTVNDTLFVVRNKNGEPVFAVFPEGVHVWMADGAKGNIGGFAVSGRTTGKAIYEYLKITNDSIRIYINDAPVKGNIGGFAVSGRTTGKNNLNDFFNISGNNSPDTINPSQARIVWYPKKEAFWAGRVLIKHADSVGLNSTAIGFETQAKGNWSQAFGFKTKANGQYSAAFGRLTKAIGYNSIAFGDSSISIGSRSFAFGYGSKSYGTGAIALGSVAIDNTGQLTQNFTTANGNYSFAAGMGAITTSNGWGGVAIGGITTCDGPFCASIGFKNYSTGSYSSAIGFNNHVNGNYSLALGANDSVVSNNAYAIGSANKALGNYNFAIGTNNITTNIGTTAFGTNNIVNGNFSSAYGHYVSTNGYTGAILFGDYSSSGIMMNADKANQFKVRAAGGFIFHSNSLLSEQNSVYISPVTGNMGIGIATPTAKLHVNDVLRLQPRNAPPVPANEGDIYYNALEHKLKLYNGTSWVDL